jgi:hypothetical protein
MITGSAYLPTSHGDNAYGGKSEDIFRRKEEHFKDLQAGTHPNSHLQNYYNKHGADYVKFVVIKECDPEVLNEEEIKWIEENKTYTNPNAFNRTPGGDGGATHTLEYAFENTLTGEKALGDNILAFCRLHPELNKDCMCRVHRGQQEEHKGWKRISNEG